MDNRKKTIHREIPVWLGVPKVLADKINKSFYFCLADWTDDPAAPFDAEKVIANQMYDIACAYFDLGESGKLKFADFFRFKKRYYDVLIPRFDFIDSHYKAELAALGDEYKGDERYRAGWEQRKAILPVIYKANVLAVQKCLEYVDFFFWREVAKIAKTPTDLKIVYKPQIKTNDFEPL